MNSRLYFDKVASNWEQLQQSFFSEAVREKAFVLAGIEKGRTAADIGAGNGFITEGLLARGLRVIAIDQSASMLGQMRRRFAHASGLDLRQGQAEHLPLQDGTVDYAFANMYLHHVGDPPAAIKEMARIVKSDGRLVITDLDKHTYLFLKTEHHDRWMGFKREVIKRWFEEAGLKHVTVESADQNCCATSSCGGECASVGIWVGRGHK